MIEPFDKNGEAIAYAMRCVITEPVAKLIWSSKPCMRSFMKSLRIKFDDLEEGSLTTELAKKVIVCTIVNLIRSEYSKVPNENENKNEKTKVESGAAQQQQQQQQQLNCSIVQLRASADAEIDGSTKELCGNDISLLWTEKEINSTSEKYKFIAAIQGSLMHHSSADLTIIQTKLEVISEFALPPTHMFAIDRGKEMNCVYRD